MNASRATALVLAALVLTACDQPANKPKAATPAPSNTTVRSATGAPVATARPEGAVKNSPTTASKPPDAVPAPDTRPAAPDAAAKPPAAPEAKPESKPEAKPETKPDAEPGGVLKHTETDSGLIIDDLKFGTGVEAKPHQTVTIHYRGTLPDGTEFDSSYKSGSPSTFELDRLVKGWQEGIPGMKVGGKRRLIVPPELGYGKKEIKGPNGQILIPANSMLIFEIELFGVQ